MKILIVNYRYFISGGPERYLFNLKELLELKGHHIIPFSVRYKQNLYSEYEKYFVTPLSREDEIYFRDHSWNVKSIIKTVARVFYSIEVYKSLSKLIKENKPDFAIVLHYAKKLSPAVLKALNDQKIPFVVRLSDFGLICPNAHLLRQDTICELCIKGNIINSVKYKCVQNSWGASMVNYLATKFHLMMGYYNYVSDFIVPSKFTIKKIIEGGWNPDRFNYIPTFINTNKQLQEQKKDQIIYVGRLEKIKGVHILLRAIQLLQNNSNLKFNTIITGTGPSDYIEMLETYVIGNGLSNVKFTGQLEKPELEHYISESLISVVPSLCYDNMPNSVLESLALGTPVIATDHGSFSELVFNYVNGLLFENGNSEDLSEKIRYLFENRETCIKMGQKGIEFVNQNFSKEMHYESLLNVFNKIKNK